MAVQKKKKAKKKPSENPNNIEVFKWTPQRKKAALLLSEGTKTYEEVAETVRIHISTLWLWRQSPIFLAEVDRLTLENEKATRAGLVRLALNGLDKKKNSVDKDRSTALDYLKFIADIQGYSKQKIELDANLKHSQEVDIKDLSDEELMEIIKNESEG